MAERQQRKANEAAQKFAESLTEAWAQELNAQLTQEFFNGVINNLRVQAESNRALADDLIAQQRKQQEASQALIQESVDAAPSRHGGKNRRQGRRGWEADAAAFGLHVELPEKLFCKRPQSYLHKPFLRHFSRLR